MGCDRAPKVLFVDFDGSSARFTADMEFAHGASTQEVLL
jgi:hypothetical protein